MRPSAAFGEISILPQGECDRTLFQMVSLLPLSPEAAQWIRSRCLLEERIGRQWRSAPVGYFACVIYMQEVCRNSLVLSKRGRSDEWCPRRRDYLRSDDGRMPNSSLYGEIAIRRILEIAASFIETGWISMVQRETSFSRGTVDTGKPSSRVVSGYKHRHGHKHKFVSRKVTI